MINGLYKVIEKDSDKIIVHICDKHIIFDAHFPDFPILPGFAQIDIFAESLNDTISKITLSKFIKHIKPNDIVEYRYKIDSNKVSVKTYVDEFKVMELKYER